MANNNLIVAAAMKYLGTYDGPRDFNNIVLAAANKYLGADPKRRSLNGAVLAALNKYTTTDGKSLNSAIRNACIQYGITGRSLSTIIDKAMSKFLVGKTEVDFDAHIATLAVNGSTVWGDSAAAGRWRTTVGAPTGPMFGSSWLDSYWSASTTARAIQHALPSPAGLSLVVLGQQVYFRTTASAPVLIWTGKDRNGYESISEDDGIADNSLVMGEYIRWDRGLGKAFRGTPFSGAAETEYTW